MASAVSPGGSKKSVQFGRPVPLKNITDYSVVYKFAYCVGHKYTTLSGQRKASKPVEWERD